MTGQGSFWFGSSDFYPETIDQSLRFEDGDSAYLLRTPSSAGNHKSLTISMWVKRGNITSNQVLMNVFVSASPNNQGVLRFNSSDQLQFTNFSGEYDIVTNRKFRDTTNWYHILIRVDTTNSTASERIKIYINGTLETSLATSTYPTQNLDLEWNTTNKHLIGARTDNSTPTPIQRLDGYLAEVNLVDGEALGPESFGETKNGVWISKGYSSSYGTNGFRLTFADSSSLGDDTSGNGNDFTSSGLASTDVVPDSPTNNFCTFNPLDPTNMTLAEGNLETDKAANASNDGVNGTFLLTSGKWYFEFKPKYFSGGSGGFGNVGVRNPSGSAKDALGSGNAPNATVLYLFDGNVQDFNSDTSYATSGSGNSYGATGSEMIYGVALDMDNGKIWFSINGTYPNSGDPASGTNEARDDINTNHPDGVFPAISSYNVAFIANFGQNPSFNGDVGNSGHTAGTESDSNGIGLFKYAPPSGFLAICSSNLPDTTISPNKSTQADDHFNTVLYTGNGTSQSITGVGFQPDWVWAKTRNDGSLWHFLLDSSRGGNARLYSNGTGAESTSVNNITSFDSDGFSVGSAVNLNKSSEPIVAWNWKAGGSAPTKTYKVVVVSDSGNKYRFRNSADSATFAQSAVTLDLQEGGTYTFDLSDSSMSGHPLRFSTTSDGTHGGGSEYTTGVTTNGTAGSSGATVTITVASSAPTLYYYCSNHSGMGGQIDTNTTFGQTNFDGSILSVEQASTDAGFSIVLYASGSSGDKTIGHGLSSKPEFIISKSRDASSSYSWVVYHEDVASTVNKYLALNATDALSDNGTGIWGSAFPTSTVFGITSGNGVNANTNCIAYCFHSVEGYSKFGTYTGNSSADGTFIYTGFRPAWIMVKKTTGADDWIIHDNARSPFNVVNGLLEANTSDAEFSDDSCDFLSNGFKWRLNSGARNTSGQTYLYMAFSDGQTAKFSNAR